MVLWEDMNLRAMNSLYDEKGNGLFQKKSTPPVRRKARFFLLPPPPLHHNFQNCLSTPPLRISKFKDPPTHPDFYKIVSHRNLNLHST